jgi:uncharacterized protein with von Willebrand factor type A (vWA) domain
MPRCLRLRKRCGNERAFAGILPRGPFHLGAVGALESEPFGEKISTSRVAMPIYEFYSPDTHRIYSFFARSLSQGNKTPRCPDNAKARMERVVSRFAVTGRAKEKTESPNEALDPRMEQAMAEMEREMSSMSDENPNPRQIAKIMRTMSQAAGRKLPETMERMIQRLEKGEDPERIEEDFGESMMDGMEEEFGEENLKAAGVWRPKTPARDPKLYEMAEYL